MFERVVWKISNKTEKFSLTGHFLRLQVVHSIVSHILIIIIITVM